VRLGLVATIEFERDSSIVPSFGIGTQRDLVPVPGHPCADSAPGNHDGRGVGRARAL